MCDAMTEHASCSVCEANNVTSRLAVALLHGNIDCMPFVCCIIRDHITCSKSNKSFYI